MRIWDVNPSLLCQKHLLGEHRELHAVWTVITNNKTGYSQHPETRRWVNNLAALYNRHNVLVEEMKKRGYRHHSNLDKKFATGKSEQKILINSVAEQLEILKMKPCDCPL